MNEEIDETVFWLEVAFAVHPPAANGEGSRVLREGVELRSMFAAARRTYRINTGTKR